MTEPDALDQELREIAERLVAQDLGGWNPSRLLDYLEQRREDDPLGKPTEVELALWHFVREAYQLGAERERKACEAIALSPNTWKKLGKKGGISNITVAGVAIARAIEERSKGK